VDENIRDWPVRGIFSCTSILIFSYILLWFSIFKDKLDLMRMIGSFQIVLFVLIFFFTCFLTADLRDYKKDFECFQTMAMIHEGDFKEFSCRAKYRDYSTSI
jgi:hypothetical protein